VRAAMVIVLVLAVVLTGCAPQVAAFRHPRTGDEQRCENYAKTGALVFGAVGATAESVKYADCKTSGKTPAMFASTTRSRNAG